MPRRNRRQEPNLPMRASSHLVFVVLLASPSLSFSDAWAQAKGVSSVTPYSTAAAAEAGARTKPGTTANKNLVDTWLKLLRERKGRELTDAIEKKLRADDPLRPGGSFAEIFDFFHYLDENPRESVLVYGDFNVAFAMANLVLRNEERVALFSHFLLYATLPNPKVASRSLLYRFLPLFLEYHRGRFVELREAFHEDLDRQLSLRKMSLRTVLDAMPRAEYFPELDKIAQLLVESDSLNDTTALLEHLVSRDDDAAARVVRAYVEKLGDYRLPLVEIALGALVRMKADAAEQAVAFYMSGRIRESVEPATRAFFTVARDATAAFEARRFLNSDAPAKRKISFLRSLVVRNGAVLEALATKHLEALQTPEVVRHLRASQTPTK